MDVHAHIDSAYNIPNQFLGYVKPFQPMLRSSQPFTIENACTVKEQNPTSSAAVSDLDQDTIPSVTPQKNCHADTQHHLSKVLDEIRDYCHLITDATYLAESVTASEEILQHLSSMYATITHTLQPGNGIPKTPREKRYAKKKKTSSSYVAPDALKLPLRNASKMETTIDSMSTTIRTGPSLTSSQRQDMLAAKLLLGMQYFPIYFYYYGYMYLQIFPICITDLGKGTVQSTAAEALSQTTCAPVACSCKYTLLFIVNNKPFHNTCR